MARSCGRRSWLSAALAATAVCRLRVRGDVVAEDTVQQGQSGSLQPGPTGGMNLLQLTITPQPQTPFLTLLAAGSAEVPTSDFSGLPAAAGSAQPPNPALPGGQGAPIPAAPAGAAQLQTGLVAPAGTADAVAPVPAEAEVASAVQQGDVDIASVALSHELDAAASLSRGGRAQPAVAMTQSGALSLSGDAAPAGQDPLYKDLKDVDLKNGMTADAFENPPKKDAPEEDAAIKLLFADPRLKTVCQLGFNGGVSTLRWLLDTKAKIVVFDAGGQSWSEPAATWLAGQFKDRLQVVWGDPAKTLPGFPVDYPNTKCNLINVDTSPGADIKRGDMKNFEKMADPTLSVLRVGNMYCGGQFCLVRGSWKKIFSKFDPAEAKGMTKLAQYEPMETSMSNPGSPTYDPSD